MTRASQSNVGHVASGLVTWFPAANGGRVSPPDGPVYTGTARIGDHLLSIALLFRTPPVAGIPHEVEIDFLRRDLAIPHVHAGTTLILTEGEREVGDCIVTTMTKMADETSARDT